MNSNVSPLRILVVDDEPELRKTLHSILKIRRYLIDEAEDGIEALQKINLIKYDLVILDVNMPKMDGLTCLREIKAINNGMIVLIITAHANIQDAVSAIKEGAFNYIAKPIRQDDVLSLVDKALEARLMVVEMAHSSPILQIEDDQEFIGNSSEMRKIFSLIDKLTKVNTSVLIRGESGTGKELVARAIHYNGLRKEKRFVAVNCSAIPENLIESELFGHEKGSFTGAFARKIGMFQVASGGTILLDEIGDVPLSMQVKLLRVLQERVFTPIGATRDVKGDVRVIAATNRNLEDMIQKGVFREDLYYRLNVLPIYLPPLKSRVEDIPPLVNYFIEKYNRLHSKNIEGISDNALNVLKRFAWPGNIRELENVIEHAFVIESGAIIHVESLPDYLRERKHEGENTEIDYQYGKEKFEKDFILHALKMFNGRINQTAEHTNIPKTTLLRKLSKYNIDPKMFE